MSQEAGRTRTFRWSDPALVVQRARSLTGLEYLQAMASGQVPPPPIMAALGLDHLLPMVATGKVTSKATRVGGRETLYLLHSAQGIPQKRYSRSTLVTANLLR